MKELLKLDFFIQKKYIKSSIIVFLFLGITFALTQGMNYLYTMGTFIVFYLTIIPIEVERKSKFNIYLNSLPNKKSNYIYSKYLSTLIYIIVVNLFLYLFCTILGVISGSDFTLTLRAILPNIIVQLFYVSLTLPVYMIISHKFYRVVNIIFTILIMMISSILFNSLENENLQVLFNITNGVYGLAFGILALIISLIVSLNIYKKVRWVNMKNLIIKDLKNIRVIFIFYILTMTFGYSPFFIDLPKDRYDFLINSVFIYFTLLASMISVNFIIAKNTNKGAMTNKLLRSLPIDARSVVGTSFILPILIFLIFSLPNILVGMGVSFMLGEKIIVNPFNLLLTFIIFYIYASITFSMAIIYPESSVVSYLRSVPLFILIIGLALVEKFMKNINYDVSNILNSLPLVVLILAVISIFILIVFYKFSLNKFIRKEL